jgi:hypothetical protein
MGLFIAKKRRTAIGVSQKTVRQQWALSRQTILRAATTVLSLTKARPFPHSSKNNTQPPPIDDKLQQGRTIR